MSVSISPNGAAVSFVPALMRRSTEQDQSRPGRGFSLARQLSVISEMLKGMDTLTVPGQHHTMTKVVGFVGDQIERANLTMNQRNRRVLAELVRQLTRESQRRSPNVKFFIQRADSLLTLLGGVA